jgi:DNA-binding CsgD family transcriptional regulator
VTALVTAIVGAAPGDGLRRVTAQAAGNPLYVRELVDALLREQAVRISPVAEVAPAGEWRPVSLAAVLDDRLSSVSAETAQLLRTAALLGGRFAVTDLAVVLRRPVSDLAVSLQEAVAAGIVDGSGAELAFRHPLIRQALYESMPEALRTALHAEAARELAAAGADALSVAQQLSAARRPGEGWARASLIQAVPTLTTRAPQLAVELLRGELQETPVSDEAWDALLIAVRREQRTMAGRHLREGLALPIETLTDRENRDFLVAAHALSLEQSGETRQAMLRLAEIFPRRDDEMTLIHQWLPDLVRLALAAGDRPMAQAAAKACEQEAAAGSRAARAAAASLRCYGLLESDPDRLREAVAHYRAAGPAVELPAALEDLAEALAERGREADARAALNEAVGLYEGMGARWDIRRAEGRLRQHGIKRGVRGRRPPRATAGWAALTPTEVKIAALIARGDSTSDIALSMFLSRRTVQTYISHILTKLGAKGRADIVRETLLQGISP